MYEETLAMIGGYFIEAILFIYSNIISIIALVLSVFALRATKKSEQHNYRLQALQKRNVVVENVGHQIAILQKMILRCGRVSGYFKAEDKNPEFEKGIVDMADYLDRLKALRDSALEEDAIKDAASLTIFYEEFLGLQKALFSESQAVDILLQAAENQLDIYLEELSYLEKLRDARETLNDMP
jgi:hypothetical protein